MEQSKVGDGTQQSGSGTQQDRCLGHMEMGGWGGGNIKIGDWTQGDWGGKQQGRCFGHREMWGGKQQGRGWDTAK